MAPLELLRQRFVRPGGPRRGPGAREGAFCERWLANPISDRQLVILSSAVGGGWVWKKGDKSLRFTDLEIQAFGDGIRAGEFTPDEVKPGG